MTCYLHNTAFSVWTSPENIDLGPDLKTLKYNKLSHSVCYTMDIKKENYVYQRLNLTYNLNKFEAVSMQYYFFCNQMNLDFFVSIFTNLELLAVSQFIGGQ